jgi:predicted PurR-regulated permease PerM
MRSETLRWVVRGAGFAIGVGLIAILGYLAFAARDVLFLVFLSILLGAGLEPVIGAIRTHLPIGRAAGILVVYAAFLIGVVALVLVIVPAAATQIELAVGRLPTFLETIRGGVDRLRPTVLADGLDSLIQQAESALKPATPDPGTVVGTSIAIAGGAAAVVTLLTLVFFWLTERSRLQRYALAFVPRWRRAGIRDAWNEVETRLGLWVRGQLILMGTLGLMTAVAYSLLGLPAALLLAVIAAVAEIIPLAGPLIGAVPALLVATTVSMQTAILTLVVYVALQFIEGNILVPIVMRNAIGLSPFLVAVSLLVGYTAGGPLGAIIAVPLVAAIEAVLERLQARDVPVPLDPAGLSTPTEDQREELEARPPDQPRRRATRPARATRSAGSSPTKAAGARRARRSET